MQDIYCPLQLTGVAAALTGALGVPAPQSAAPALEALTTLCEGGVDRILMYITGMQNIRDVQPFPRTPKTAEF